MDPVLIPHGILMFDKSTILVLIALFYLMPVYFMVINGLMDKSCVSLSTMWHFLHNPSGSGFGEAFDQ